MQLFEKKITALREIAPAVFVLSFERNFDFKAGQVIALSLDPSEDPRVYSIASGTDEAFVEILFDIKPEGFLTPRLALLEAGDSIYVSLPFGSFLGMEGPATWVASGTGIAPFRSMFRSGLGEDKVLLQGGRFRHSFYFSEEFEGPLGEAYTRCCSRDKGEELYNGRVTDYIEAIEAPDMENPWYLCGSAEMVIACREILLIKGVRFDRILSEVYF